MKTVIILALVVPGAILHAATPLTCAVASSGSPTGPTSVWDTSGNGLLSGAYNFRYVQYSVGDQQGDLSHAVALYGTITFTAGSYTIMGMQVDSNSTLASAVSQTYQGTYSISACGFGFLSNPLSSGDQIWGLVSRSGVFVGSTTETQNPFSDLLIAAPAPSPLPTNASLQGSYSVAYLNFEDGYVADTVTAGFQMAPNGSGNIGAVNIQMFQGSTSSPINVTERASYGFSNGVGSLGFPSYAQAISRSKRLYVSEDGNLIFGGDPNWFDIFVGVRTTPLGIVPGSPNAGFGVGNFGGLYYQAGIDEIMSSAGGTLAGSLQTYYGAFNASPAFGAFNASSGTILDHQRIVAPLRSPLQPTGYPYQNFSYPYQPFSYTYADTYTLAFGFNTGYTDTAMGRQYVIGGNGMMRLGFGMYPNLGISIALQAPGPAIVTPPVYINPIGILNAASYAPYTSGISPGELIAIYGSNLATAGATTQVTIDGLPAQVIGVPSATQLTVLVPPNIEPSSTTGQYAQIQVTNNGQASNIVWTFVNGTTPSVFTQAQNGLGDADAFHSSNNTLVTPSSPSTAGETIYIATTGVALAGASSGIGGTTASIPPSSIAVTIGGMPAPVGALTFSAVGAGVYNISVIVPKGTSLGEVPLVVCGPDGTTAQATIFVGAKSGS